MRYACQIRKPNCRWSRETKNRRRIFTNKWIYVKDVNNMFNTIDEAITDLKLGKQIIVVDDESRENEGNYVALSSTISPEVINLMITEERRLICLKIKEEISRRLNLNKMVETNTDHIGTAFTESVDYETTTTGISAFERADTIKAIVNENTKEEQFK